MKAGKVGGSSPSAEVAEARRGRWLRIASKLVGADRENEKMIPAAWFEEVEGRPLEEVVVDRLAESRGLAGVSDDPLRSDALAEDGRLERIGGRSLAAHDRDIVRVAVREFTLPLLNFALNRREQRAFVRRFYVAGDFGIHAAKARALRFAVRQPSAKAGAVRLASFDAKDRATIRKLAKNNGVSVREMADNVGRIAAGRRVSRRIDWRT